MILSSGLAPVVDLRHAGCHVGLGCDGSSSADSASLWQEARLAMLQGKLKSGADAMDARTALEISTRGGAGCLGRIGEIGELSVGAVGDIAVWKLDGPIFAGVLDDLIEGWLRTGPHSAWHTVVAGRLVVESGLLVAPDLDEKLAAHAAAARRFQPTD
jgi:cytosine/adenosine deaminase-related metal-dependent hydrolase